MRHTRLFPTSLLIGLLLVACSDSSPSDSGDSSTGGSNNGGSSGSNDSAGAPNAGTAAGGEGGTGGSNTGGSAGTGGDTPAMGGESTGGAGGTNAGAGSGGEPADEPDAGESPPGLPAGYTLQLEESFASAAALSRVVFANPTEWSHAEDSGGYLQATGHSYNNPQYYSPHSIAVLKEKTFGSFVLEVELLQTTMTGGHRDFAIFWGVQGPNQFYYAHIGQAHDAASHNIHIVDNSDRTPITDTFTDGFDWGDGVWHQFRVVRDIVSGSMEVYGDDDPAPILTANDTTLGEGYIGFGSFDDNGAVRNVRIWALESSAQPATFFESAP